MTRDVVVLDVDGDVQCAESKPSDGAPRTGNGLLHSHAITVRSQKFSSTEFQAEFS